MDRGIEEASKQVSKQASNQKILKILKASLVNELQKKSKKETSFQIGFYEGANFEMRLKKSSHFSLWSNKRNGRLEDASKRFWKRKEKG